VAGLRRPESPAERPPADERRSSAAEDTQVIPKVPAEPTPPPASSGPSEPERPRPSAKRQPRPAPRPSAEPRPERPRPARPADAAAAQPEPVADAVERPRRTGLLVPGVLGLVAVLIGGLAVWFGLEWSHVRGGADVSNTALTDNVTTSEVSGQVTNAINTVFSIDYTNLAKSQNAVPKLLTGTAQCQYNELFKVVKQLAPSEKLVLTTTVQDRGVEMLQGDTARVLLLVDQHDLRATTNQTSDAKSMFAVNAVKQGTTWKISSINTFNSDNPTNCK
jgi:Mce-associated membrane protein